MPYLLLFITLVGMVSSQLLLKKGMQMVGQFPQGFPEIIRFFLKAFSNPYVLGAIGAIFIGSLAWIAAVSKSDLSRSYPVLALSYILVVLLSILVFKENVGLLRWIGVILICLGVFFVART
jgi:drug/metabolite transporter (DMT)-like permease